MKISRLFLLSAGVLASAAHAADVTWNGATSNAWATATNWDGGSVPASGDNIIIADTTANNAVLSGDTTIGSFTFGDTGTRDTAFTLTSGANVLTIQGGVTASHATSGVKAKLSGNLTVDGDQTWTIANTGEGAPYGSNTSDAGFWVEGGASNRNLVLNGNLLKEGSGTLIILDQNISGAGDIIVNAGGLKFNAGSSRPLTLGGTGTIRMNNNSVLMFSKNSGSVTATQAIVMNDTSAFHVGGANGSDATIASAIAWNGTHDLQAVATSSGASKNTTFSGAWAGSGTINRTGGTSNNYKIDISGDNTGFSGTLNLSYGTTNLTGDFGASTISTSGGTSNLSGEFTGTTIKTSGGTANLSGTFGESTVSVSGGTANFSGTLGSKDIAFTGGVINVNADNASGTGTINHTASSGTSRVVLNAVEVANNFIIDSSAVTSYEGAITASGTGNSTINGDIVVKRGVGNGGHLAATANATLTLNGALDANGVEIITHRIGTITYAGGGSTDYLLQVTGTAKLGADDGIATGAIARLGISNNVTGHLDLNGYNQTLRGLEKGDSAAIVTNSSDTASLLTVGNDAADNVFAGAIQDGTGGVSLTKAGSNTLTLSGNNTYTGDSIVSAGTLLVTGKLADTAVTVESGASFGGTGTLGGTLHLAAGSRFDILDLQDPLTVSGTITLGPGFSIESLVQNGEDVNWIEIANGTYTLISGTLDPEILANLDNLGETNAYDIGGDRAAYFETGSLNLVVIPEVSSALLVGLGALALLRRRRD